MSTAKYLKFLFSIELHDRVLNNPRHAGRRVPVPGWNRVGPLPTAPYASVVSSATVPSPRASYRETGEDIITPAGRMTDYDYNVVHGNIVANAARQAAHRRAAGR